jgi:hypothetical protein
VESIPNVWLINTIPYVLVLQDMLVIPMTGVSWIRDHLLQLMFAIPVLVDQILFVQFWMGEQSVTV